MVHLVMYHNHYGFCLHFSAYQVIVLKVVDEAEELPDDYDSKLKDANNAIKDNLNFYIAAELLNDPVYENSWEFTIGDDKTYGAYVNKGLERGEEYIVFQRALTYGKSVSKYESVTQFNSNLY